MTTSIKFYMYPQFFPKNLVSSWIDLSVSPVHHDVWIDSSQFLGRHREQSFVDLGWWPAVFETSHMSFEPMIASYWQKVIKDFLLGGGRIFPVLVIVHCKLKKKTCIMSN